MASDLPLYHQNTQVNITVLVVDDDPIFLSIISNMLKTPSYKDKSFGEIIVMTANNSSEAVSTLRGQRNNIDVIITDYHMPGLNGIQLKKRIDEEFGKFPVIVISADMNNEIEQETLSSGAMSFMRKPIKPKDLNTVWKHALNSKKNDGSKKIQKTSSSSNDQCDGDSRPQAATKTKISWTRSLEHLFFKAIHHIGVQKATPKKILEYMNVDYLTRAHVASKLQKYRELLKKVKAEGIKRSRIAMNSNLTSSSYINPQQCSYNNNNSISSFNCQQRSYGLGQSSLMMNNNVGLHDSVNYMNRRPTFDLSQTGPNLLPMGDSIGFSNGMLSIKQERGSTFGTSQVYQDPLFAQYGTTSDVLGMNSNLSTGTMGSNYAGIKINKNGHLVGLGGIRVNGTESGSLGGIRVNDIENGNGYLGGIRVHGTGNGNGNDFLGEITVHGDGIGNDSLGGTRVDGIGNGSGVHGTDNGNGSFGGIRVDGIGIGNGNCNGSQVHYTGNGNGSLGEIRVDGIGNNYNGNGNGNDNGYVGENLGGMNWNFSNNNMSNHGSSTSRFPSALSFLDSELQSQNNLIAQTNGVAPLSKNPSIFNDHHGINKNESKTTTENLGMSTDLEKNAIFGAYYPLEDIGNNNEETVNTFDANSEMYFPTHQDMSSTNPENDDTDLADLLLSFDQGWSDEDLMNYLLSDDMNR